MYLEERNKQDLDIIIRISD